jgi:hypothetical protein
LITYRQEYRKKYGSLIQQLKYPPTFQCREGGAFRQLLANTTRWAKRYQQQLYRLRKSADKPTNPETLAPSTFQTPISFGALFSGVAANGRTQSKWR